MTKTKKIKRKTKKKGEKEKDPNPEAAIIPVPDTGQNPPVTILLAQNQSILVLGKCGFYHWVT